MMRAVRIGAAPSIASTDVSGALQNRVLGEAAEAAIGRERCTDLGEQGVQRRLPASAAGCVTNASTSARWL